MNQQECEKLDRVILTFGIILQTICEMTGVNPIVFLRDTADNIEKTQLARENGLKVDHSQLH